MEVKTGKGILRLSKLNDAYRGGPDPEITGLTADSRSVGPGYLFAALPGAKTDGARFIGDAVKKGAAAVLAARGVKVPEGVALIESENPRRDFALLAAKFFMRQPRTIVAVTGTNGKTSSAHFAQQIWESLGHKAVSLGTIGVRGCGMDRDGSLTTPDPAALHEELARLADAGVTHLAMEASSHGLSQFRIDGVKIRAAAFTNITRDHLDYHGDMADYFSSKMRLFSEVLPPGGTAVLNADIPEYDELKELCAQRGLKIMGYGEKGGDIKLLRRAPRPGGQDLLIEAGGAQFDIVLPLVGSFMAMNALCALGLIMACGASAEEAVGAMAGLKGAPGRLQIVEGHPSGAAIYVDYAHTPDALENILRALRPHTKGKLFCIIGCGGDRDPGKRHIMGKIADDMADIAIITDDNPRSEDPAKIRAAMMAGTRRAREIGGRREAVRAAVRDLEEGDVLVIAGKGHEQGQIIGSRVEPFDDVSEARKAIAQLKSEAAA